MIYRGQIFGFLGFRYGLFWLSLILLWVNCSGLVNLKLPRNSEVDAWSTVYQSNLRHNSLESDIAPPYQVMWDRKYKSVITDQPLALGNYLIFTLKNGNIAFLDILSGELIGDGRLAPAFEHAPVIDGKTIYYSAKLGSKTLAAMNLLTREKIWETRLPHLYTAPLIWQGRIYAGSRTGELYCVDKKTGQVLWTFQARSTLQGIPAESRGSLYFCDIKGNLYCLDGNSGTPRWIISLQPNAYNGPVVADNRLFIGTTSGIFYAIDADSGAIVWQTETKGSIYGNAAYFDGMLYVGNNAHLLYAIRARDGEIQWKFQTGGIINTTPLVSTNHVYFGSWDNHLYILSRLSGEKIVAFDLKKPIKSSPLIHRNRLMVQTANDRLFCIAHREELTEKE